MRSIGAAARWLLAAPWLLAALVLGAGCGGSKGLAAHDGGASAGDSHVASLDGGDGLAGACDPLTAGGCGLGACRLTCRPDRTLAAVCGGAGSKKPGDLCAGDEECEPGAQCFHLSCGGGSSLGTCLRLCTDDSQCGGTACATAIPCGGPGGRYRTCARPCDPLGDGKTGCADGLRCFVFGNETADCACLGATHVKAAGDACDSNDECQPGFYCVEANGARSCRPLCRLADATTTCPTGTTCTRLIEPAYSYRVYGACLPSP